MVVGASREPSFPLGGPEFFSRREGWTLEWERGREAGGLRCVSQLPLGNRKS